MEWIIVLSWILVSGVFAGCAYEMTGDYDALFFAILWLLFWPFCLPAYLTVLVVRKIKAI